MNGSIEWVGLDDLWALPLPPAWAMTILTSEVHTRVIMSIDSRAGLPGSDPSFSCPWASYSGLSVLIYKMEMVTVGPISRIVTRSQRVNTCGM